MAHAVALRVQTSDAPGREFEKAVEAQAHTAFVEAVEAIFAYAAPVLHTVTIEGQAVTGELDDNVVDDAAYVPLVQAVQTASVVKDAIVL